MVESHKSEEGERPSEQKKRKKGHEKKGWKDKGQKGVTVIRRKRKKGKGTLQFHFARAISTAAAIGHARVLVKHASGLNRRAALLRKREREATPPAAVALANGFLNSLGAGMAAGQA